MKNKSPGKLSIIIFIFIVLLVYAWEQIESERLGYRLQSLRQEIEKEKNHIVQLDISLSYLRSPERLDSISHKMNFGPPKKDQIKTIP